MNYDVFISFKNLDENGNLTEDSEIASMLYQALDKKGLKTFYSNIRLFEFGEAAYKEAIEKALEEAHVMIVVSTNVEYLRSRWVSYERESYHEDILSGRKKDAYIVPYLKNINGVDVPRSLRGYETFKIGENSIDQVVDFVIQCLKKHDHFEESRVVEKSLITGKSMSTYSPTENKEFRRLKIQANNTAPADNPAINYALEHLPKKDKIFILDAGCAYGFVTEDRFDKIDNSLVLGVDISDKCIEYARSHTKSNHIFYEHLNLEDEDFEDNIESLMGKYDIPQFDIIFASLVIHHLKNPNKFLRRVRRYLSSDGYIIIRGSDDGSNIACNDDGLIDKIVQMHLKADGISDRLNGRKIYSQLIASGYKDIKMMNYVKDISGLDMDQRMDVFTERFSYRRNYLKKACDENPYDMQKKNELEIMDFALEKLENKFSEDSFWYCEIDFVGVAKKK